MYYIHLILDEGFFPRPEDIEQTMEANVHGGNIYFSAYDRGIIAVYPSKWDRTRIVENMKDVVHIAKVVYKRSTEYKYQIRIKWRKT